MKEKLLLLGSTGSIGEQALDVAEKTNIEVESLCANKNFKRVEEQARKFNVKYCAMSDEASANELKTRLADTNIKVFSGEDGILEMIGKSRAEVALNSIIGYAGLLPTLEVLKNKKRLALANKESLVVAGEYVMNLAKKQKIDIIPVDSEHCAIHQCLRSGKSKEVKKLILTASGGPFFGKTKDEIKNLTKNEALAHPTWSMGQKITIDSATLMNKGFEVTEASFLFSVPASKIDVLVHRESIIHSMVEYIDNSIIAEMSVPDMRFCVQYALNNGNRFDGVINELDLSKICNLTFNKPDRNTFGLLDLALKCLDCGGASSAVLNASNEIAVWSFLDDKIKFGRIEEIVTQTVENLLTKASKIHNLNDLFEIDKEAREYAKSLI